MTFGYTLKVKILKFHKFFVSRLSRNFEFILFNLFKLGYLFGTLNQSFFEVHNLLTEKHLYKSCFLKHPFLKQLKC